MTNQPETSSSTSHDYAYKKRVFVELRCFAGTDGIPICQRCLSPNLWRRVAVGETTWPSWPQVASRSTTDELAQCGSRSGDEPSATAGTQTIFWIE